MSLNITNKLNNLSATIEIIVSDIDDLQNLVWSYFTLDDARTLYQLLSNIASSCRSNPTDNMYYSAMYKYINQKSKKTISCSLPLIFDNNILSIDLFAYQKVVTCNSPLSVSNNRYIDWLLTAYQQVVSCNTPLSIPHSKISIDLHTYATQVHVANAISNFNKLSA